MDAVVNGKRFHYEVGDSNRLKFVVGFGKREIFNSNEVYIDVGELLRPQDINDAIMMVYGGVSGMNRGVDGEITFVVHNKKEEDLVNSLISEYRIVGRIDKSNFVKEEKENEMVENFYDKLVQSGKTVTTNNNGIIRKYTADVNGNMTENIGTLSLAEEMKVELAKLQQSSKWANVYSKMGQDELMNELYQIVTTNRKKYEMKSGSDVSLDNSRKENVVNAVAHHEDGRYNEEIGIVQSAPGSVDMYKSVEENQGHIEVVTPTVAEQNINGSGTTYDSGSSYGYSFDAGSDGIGSLNEEMTEEATLSEEEELQARRTQEKGKVRTLKREKRNWSNAAFVSLPVIIFVLSFLLLVASVVILVLMN